ncbi:MAG: xanthine dehydrogenase family protein subunit M [Chloroflexota bacterium]
MHTFSYARAASPEEASALLAQGENVQIIGGGTDMLPLMKEEIYSPATLVDLSAWQDGHRIDESPSGLRIGALSTLASIAMHPKVLQNYTALADACGLAASPQLRNMGTIGGNLLQQTRCWYYRGPFDCWLKGGDVCYARKGENEQHAIFHTDPKASVCVSAHPSDSAAALLALDGSVEYTTPEGSGSMPLSKFYRLPTSDTRTMVTLPENAVVTAILLPQRSSGDRSLYKKAMPRAAWAFALAGVTIAVRMDGDVIREARVALSGVAPVPFRVVAVEERMLGQRLSELSGDLLGEELTKEAAPLSQNGYKVPLLRGLFGEALTELQR